MTALPLERRIVSELMNAVAVECERTKAVLLARRIRHVPTEAEMDELHALLVIDRDNADILRACDAAGFRDAVIVDASSDTLKASLDDAGYGDFGPI